MAGNSGVAGNGGTGGSGPGACHGVVDLRAGAAAALHCEAAADCDRKIGERACGSWTCNTGTCEVAYRCDDADADGFGSGPDCACRGTALDCDDSVSTTTATASAACCNGGTRTCSAGVWGLCSGATGESCNGVDDDCNGTTDDLGEFSCGIGACRRSVPACTGGVLGVCVPGEPLSDTDGCNGIDDDCDGAIDEDCERCIRVAPDGDDALAALNPGTTPFKNIQVALDFADAHRSLSNRVCVAAGAACRATATYAGPDGADLTMREGISLHGNYESTCWSRCADSSTTLSLTTSRGIVFPPGMAIRTTLDGFSIDRLPGPITSAVTVDGARGVVLSHVNVGRFDRTYDPTDLLTDRIIYGVTLNDGADATIQHSRIDASGSHGSAAILSVGSRVVVEDSCPAPLDPVTGGCSTDCSVSGNGITSFFGRGNTDEHAISLVDSPGSRIERSAVCVSNLLAQQMTPIRIAGKGAGIVVHQSSVGGRIPQPSIRARGITLTSCGGDAPWIVGNHAIGFRFVGDAVGVLASGDCHPVIEANQRIVNTSIDRGFTGTGVACTGEAEPNRCVVRDNALIQGVIQESLNYVPGRTDSGIGVACSNGCSQIRNNSILGISGVHCSVSSCVRSGTGVSVAGGSTLIEANVIRGGTGSGEASGIRTFLPTGIRGTTGGRIIGNQIFDGMSGAAMTLESNRISGCGYYVFRNPDCAVVSWDGGGTLRNNCLSGGVTAFRESGAAADPAIFENNSLSGSPLYVDEAQFGLTDAAAINALTDMTVSGTTTGTCAL